MWQDPEAKMQISTQCFISVLIYKDYQYLQMKDQQDTKKDFTEPLYNFFPLLGLHLVHYFAYVC